MKPEAAMPRDTLPIGKVAAGAGVNVQTLRYYERRGILPRPKRTAAGYRVYAPETVGLIRFIKRAQELGFTLEEAEELLELRRLKGKSRGEVRVLAQNKLDAIDQKLSGLTAMRGAIAALLDSCACSNGGATCPILEALEQADASAPKPTKARSKKMKEVSFPVEGMSCEGCASRIKSGLANVEGVRVVEVDVAGKRVSVRFSADQVAAEGIGAAIGSLGYRVGTPQVTS